MDHLATTMDTNYYYTTTTYDVDGEAFSSALDNVTGTTESNKTSSSSSFFYYEKEQLTFLSIMFIFIVFGNSAVLLALTLSKSKKSRMNFFITHLALADLSVGLISVLTDIIWKITIAWYAGNVLCKIIRYSQVLVTYSSTYVLVALSIDRYDAITHPMKFTGSWRRARVLVFVAWALSALFSTPILVFYEETYVEGRLQCWIDLGEAWKWQLYMVLISLSLFIIPAFIISACYAIIVFTIWSKSKILTPSAPWATDANNTDKQQRNAHEPLRKLRHHVTEDGDSKRASSRGLIPRAKIKTVKMTFVIVFVFILCWSPYFVYDLLQVYGYIEPSATNNAIATFIQSLAPLNSAANPIIYCLFSTRICRNLRKIPLVEWLVSRCCVCWPSFRRPLRDNTISRSSNYTTATESFSRSSRRSSSSCHQMSLLSTSTLRRGGAGKTTSHGGI